MKLNTLLLTSAAALMATSAAFAADLPSKKAAPAATSVQVCKVGGMTGWTLPGSDTCVSIGGRVTFDMAYDLDAETGDGESDWTMAGGYRLNIDARSNTEIGVVRSFIGLNEGGYRKAYIQFAGITAGVKDSLSDVYGTTANNPTLSGNPSTGIDYQIVAGGLTFAIGAENAINNNEDAADSGDRPDLIVALGGKAGPIGFKVAAASHEAVDELGDTHNGYALKAGVNAAFGDINVIGFGGIANGASKYIGGKTDEVDFVDGESMESSVYGGEINAKFGKTLVAVEAARYSNKFESDTDTTTEFDVYLSHELAKGLTIQPEYTHYTYHLGGESATHSNEFLVRIQRDF